MEEEETLRVVSMDSNSVPTTHRGLALTRGPTRIYKSRGTLRKQTTHHAGGTSPLIRAQGFSALRPLRAWWR